MKKKLIIMTLVGLLLIALSIGVYAAGVYEEKENVDSELQYIQQEVEKKEDLVTYYQRTVESSSASIAEKEQQIAEYDEWLVTVSEEINKILVTLVESEEQYAENLEKLRMRLRTAYLENDVNLLDIIAGSDSYAEISQKIEIQKYLAEYDQKLINQIVNQKSDLEIKRIEAEDLKFSYEVQIDRSKVVIENFDKTRVIALDKVQMGTDDLDALEAREKDLLEESAKLTNAILELQKKVAYVGGEMIWPLPSDTTLATRDFGMKLHPIYGTWRMHTGVDLGASWNANILAVLDGVVILAKHTSGYGNYIIVDHGGGISTLYAHNNTMLVSVGDIVKQGQIISLAGSTGASTGPHLHFEVRVNGEPVDPMDYLDNTRLY